MRRAVLALGLAWFIWQRHPVSGEWSRMWQPYADQQACARQLRDFAPLRPNVKLKCLPESKQPKGKVEDPKARTW